MIGRSLVVGLSIVSAFGQVREGHMFPPEILSPEALEVRDGPRIAPSQYKVTFENEQLRCLRLTLKADEAVPMHDAADAFAICLQECHVRLMGLDGHAQDVHMEAGETRWIYGGKRSERNLNTHPMEMLLIEAKTRQPESN